jgi:UDP-N-acetylmuramoylalanine--D-glutamate ligase
MTNQSTRAASSADTALWKTLFPEPVAVLGYGVEGRSTLNHLLRRGYRDVVVLDAKAPDEPLPEGVRGVFGPAYLDGLAADQGVRTAFRAPGLRPINPNIEAFTARGGVLTSQVEAVFALFDRTRIVGVTGTVGKGTCCSLLSAMLDAAARPHRLAGNIGVPPLDALDDFDSLPPDALLLLELSSFQLSTLRVSPHVAVVLRTTVEHLDWHATRDEYWDHKANLARFQKPGDHLIYFGGAEGSAWIGGLGAGHRVCVVDATHPAVGPGVEPEDVVTLTPNGLEWPSHHLTLALADSNMTGAFNLENIAAAAAGALALGAPLKAVHEGARAFAPLEHRIEYVKTHEGVRYFNDSYATRPEAALAAVRAFDEPLGLVLGGSEKNVDFTDFAIALKDEPHLRAIALIGHTAARLETALGAAGALEGRAYTHCDTLSDALDYLRGEVKNGVILLSPACASFGLFANYKERGKAFKKLVNAL